jgi:CcmD family protein
MATGRLKAASICLCMLLVGGPAIAQPQPPKDFVAVDESQPGEQIPALPLIAGAYGFIWIGLLGYVWSVGRRLQKVEGELAELEARRK